MQNKSISYVPEFDGLRGLSALAIIYFHIYPTSIYWLWSVVDLFFVISGYLVTSIILVEKSKGKFSLFNFWVRRALRIWPVYYLTILFVAGVFLYAKGAQDFSNLYQPHFRLSLVFLQFTPFYSQVIYENHNIWEFIPGLYHSWSIAVEEQFYIVWPVLLGLMLKTKNNLLLLIGCISLVIVSAIFRNYSDVPNHLLVTRAEGLLLGAVMAIWINLGQKKATWVSFIIFTCAVIGVVLSGRYVISGECGFITPQECGDHVFTGFSLMWFCLIWCVFHDSGKPYLTLLRSGAASYFGKISYAMYMFHVPVIVFTKRLFEGGQVYDGIIVGGMIFLLTVLFSHLSLIFVERPILKLKKYFY